MSEESEGSDPYADIDNKAMPLLEKITTTLDNPRWKEEYSSELETVNQTHVSLTRAYYFMGMSAVKGTLVLFMGLLLIDLAINLQSFIYGLSANIWGTMFIIYPSLRGRYVIASISENVSKDAIREIEIRKMVCTNIGFVVLILGFVLQIFSHQMVSEEIFSTNYLESVIPSWAVFVFIFFSFIFAMRTVSN